MPTSTTPAPGDTPPEGASCGTSDSWPVPDCRVLDQLLALARHYLQSGSRRQAMDIFWSLLHRHPQTTQARGAAEELLQLARRYEHEGMTQIARDIFDRLLDANGDNHHVRR